MAFEGSGGGVAQAGFVDVAAFIYHRDSNNPFTWGSSNQADLRWDTTDANAGAFYLTLAAGDATNVPVFAVGVGIAGVDLGFFNGLTQPRIAVIDLDRDSWFAIDFASDDTARIIAGGGASTVTFGNPTAIWTGGAGAVTLRRDAGGSFLGLVGAEGATKGASLELHDGQDSSAGALIVRTPNAAEGSAIVRLTISGTVDTGAVTWAAISTFQLPASTSLATGGILVFQNTSDAASNEVLRFSGGNRGVAANNDEAYFDFHLDDDTEVQALFARMTWIAVDVATASKDGRLEFDVMVADTLTTILTVDSAGITADQLNLGVAGTTTALLGLDGATSGTVTVTVADAAGTWTFTLPTDDGDANQFLQTNGSGVTTWATVSAGAVTALNNAVANRLVTVGATTTELDAEGALTFDGSVFTVITANGIDYNPGSDADTDIVTVAVTGTPILSWDESVDLFSLNKGIYVINNEEVGFGTGDGSNPDSVIYYDGTDTFWNLRLVGTGDLMIALAGSFPSPDPDTVHIWRGDAGAVAANGDAVLAIERDGFAFFQVLSTDTDGGGLLVGSPTGGASRGSLLYRRSDDRWEILTAGGNRVFVSANAFAFQEATTISAAGDLTLDPTASLNVTLTANDADAFTANDGTTDYYNIDTRVVTNVTSHAFDATNWTDVTSSATMQSTLALFSARTMDLDGGTNVTAATFLQVDIAAITITADQATTVNQAAGMRLVAPTEGSNITLTDAIGLRIINAGGTPTNQHGILIETLTAGATADYAITIGSTDADQNLIHVGVDGDPIFAWGETADVFTLSHGLTVSAGTLTAGTVDINGGAIDGTAIGASSATTIVGTTIDATTDFTIGTLVLTDDTVTFGGAGSITGSSTMSMTSVGDMTFNPTTSFNVTLTANDADAFDANDGDTSYWLINTRSATTAIFAHTIDARDVGFASASGSVWGLISVPSIAVALTGTTQVTTVFNEIDIVGFIINGDTPTVTVDEANTFRINAPAYDGTNVSITNKAAIRIRNQGSGGQGNGTTHGLIIETIVQGGTNYQITLGNTDADQNLIHVGVTGDPIFSWAEASDQFAFSHRVAIVDGGANTLVLGDATTAVLHINNQNDSTDAAGGIVFGSSGDTNLYRSAANTLKTDDTFVSADFSLLNDWRMTESEKLGLPAGFSIIPYENAKHAVFTINPTWFELYETRVTRAQWETLVAVPDRVETLEEKVVRLEQENEELRELVGAGSDG